MSAAAAHEWSVICEITVCAWPCLHRHVHTMTHTAAGSPEDSCQDHAYRMVVWRSRQLPVTHMHRRAVIRLLFGGLAAAPAV